MATGIEGLCILLRRFAYPCRLSDLIPRFGRFVPELSEIISEVSSHIFDKYGYLFRSLDQPWLQPKCLQRFADAIYGRGSALSNCWGFVDGTVRPIARPGEHQRVLYNGHKRVHALKFQSVVAPNGLIANLYGPVGETFHMSWIFSYCINIIDGNPQYLINIYFCMIELSINYYCSIY